MFPMLKAGSCSNFVHCERHEAVFVMHKHIVHNSGILKKNDVACMVFMGISNSVVDIHT